MEDFVIENGILVGYNGNDSHVVIPQGVTEIGKGAFKDCGLIRHVNIPNTVTKIGKGAFCRCDGLVDVMIPSSVIEIGAFAFSSCKSLTNVKLSNYLEIIGSSAFMNCKSLRFIEIPNSVKALGDFVFFNCQSMEHVEISNGNKWIGLRTFTFDGNEHDVQRYEYIRHLDKLGKVKAYMPFMSDWSRMFYDLDEFFDFDDKKYEIGKKYCTEGAEYGKQGFRAYIEPLHVFEYDRGRLDDFHFAEVELSGKFDFKGGVIVGSEMKIVRELSLKELVDIFNQPNNDKHFDYLQNKKKEN